MFLRDLAYEIELAKDGYEGLEKIKQKVPNLILLDITMPKMDGYQVLLKIKSDPKIKDIPVVMCTDHSMLSDVEKCCKWGADGYVLKPYTKDGLLRKVNSVLEKNELQS